MVYLERELELPGESIIIQVVMAAVLLSIVAHGLSTLPGIARYAARLTRLDRSAPEFARVEAGSEPRQA